MCYLQISIIVYTLIDSVTITGRMVVSFNSSYAVTKYGVEAFSDALRREMQPWGIKVTMLEPGLFATNLSAPEALERGLRKRWNQLSEELKNDYGEEYLETGTYPSNVVPGA